MKKVNVNDTVRLECPARANPQITKVWFFDDEEIFWDIPDVVVCSLASIGINSSVPGKKQNKFKQNLFCNKI